MLVTSIYNLVDTAFVGQLGTSASGAVGIVFGFMSVIQAFGFMYGQGSGSLLSRALGRKDKEKASLYASTGFFSSFLTGVFISILGFVFLNPLVMILGSTETIAPFAKTYIFYILLSAPFMNASFTMNNMLRYEGKAALGMIGLITGAVLNMAGDPLFMFVFGMGIAGAGLSTALSQVFSFLILLFMFLSGKTVSKIKFINLKYFSLKLLWEIAATGFPSLLRQGLNSLNTVLLNEQCANYGDAAVSAMSITSRVIFFAFSIALGMGQGFQPVAAFNYGAKKYSRVRKAFSFTVIISEILMILSCVLIIVFSTRIVTLFRDDPKVIEIGDRALDLQALAMIALPFSVVVEMLFQSTGKKMAATLISALRNGLLFIPFIIILPLLRGLKGVQEAQPLSFLLSLPVSVIFAIWFFRKLPKEDGAGTGSSENKAPAVQADP